jgi:hypothetical protein
MSAASCARPKRPAPRFRRDRRDRRPFGWKAVRGSMGSALRLPIARADIEDVLARAKSAIA